MTSNRYYLVAALMMGLTVLIHVFAGGPEIHDPIQASSLPPTVRAVAAVIWHAITWILILMAVGIAWLSRNPNPALDAMVVAIQLGFAALFLFYGTWLLGTVWPMPQWIIFTAIPALMIWGRHQAGEKKSPAQGPGSQGSIPGE